MIELYVYYKVARSDASALREALLSFPDVRLLHRADASADPQTWMEIHASEASEAAAARAVAHLVVGQRHVERFTTP
ncbi:DUF4936 family protein [Burkholderiaceae bacterium UC74_6]